MKNLLDSLKQKYPTADIFNSVAHHNHICIRNTIGISKFGKNDKGEEIIANIYNTETIHIDTIRIQMLLKERQDFNYILLAH